MGKKVKSKTDQKKREKKHANAISKIKFLMEKMNQLVVSIKNLIEIVNNHGLMLHVLVEKGVLTHAECEAYAKQKLQEAKNAKNEESAILDPDLPEKDVQDSNPEEPTEVPEETVQGDIEKSNQPVAADGNGD